MADARFDRALAALQGLALGDALGMPTQSMSPAEIEHYYGGIGGLVDSVPEQAIAPSMPAGAITDDTEQAILLAQLMIDGQGHIDPMAFAETLLAWEDRMLAKGSHDLLGPSTKAALERVRAGEDPSTTGRFGTTNGAAMRVTPVGIAFSLDDPGAFADAVHETCMVTHDTCQGWQGALLVAAAVSAGIDGATTAEAIDEALALTCSIPARGHWSAKASITARVRAAMRGLDGLTRDEQLTFLREVVGTSVDSTESVPAALAIAREYADSPMKGLYVAANLGGDTDTIAAMAGAIYGATHGGDAFDRDALRQVVRVSHLDLVPIRDGLMAIRDSH